MHLISAFHTAGFRHVIGTLWKVEDKYCVDMANLIYKEIANGGMTDRSVSIGLHNASRALRTRWVHSEMDRRERRRVGSYGRSDDTSCGTSCKNQPEEMKPELPRDMVPDDDDDADFHWARYIHFGV